MPRRSPFRPSFGVTPPLVAGRDPIVAELADALDAGPGAPGRASLFTGNRGIGKTVMLNEVEALARSRGWVVVSETATKGLLERLTREELPDLARLLRQQPGREPRRISGVTLPAGLGGITFDIPDPQRPGGMRQQITALSDVLDAHGTGLLLTIDEVHSTAAREDIRQICAVIQHAFLEQRPVAFAAAGLPEAVQDLLTDDVSTFLRRARRFPLAPLTPPAAEEALRVPIEDAGRRVDPDALSAMAAASFGYPYFIQVIGDNAWRRESDADIITMEHAAAGIESAIRESGFAVHEPAMNDLSDMDRQFLLAMQQDAADTGDSAIADIQQRLSRNHSWTSRYRSRLIHAGVIEPAGRGRVRYALPYLAEFLAEHGDRYE
ncbi:ATP-binding protein [uncultured Corynebacterium sp.]|uniref:ATP-binding protein n=1 Tax=uncultured Corynebacterium sp. TaxID=159447 RepID=UPI0025F0674C|nr:ATP-binding protein [uncultured Corynebacterium sp.]